MPESILPPKFSQNSLQILATGLLPRKSFQKTRCRFWLRGFVTENETKNSLQILATGLLPPKIKPKTRCRYVYIYIKKDSLQILATGLLPPKFSQNSLQILATGLPPRKSCQRTRCRFWLGGFVTEKKIYTYIFCFFMYIY